MRCPVCKAENNHGAQCRRCKADLSPLLSLEERRQRTLSEVRRYLLRGEWRAAAEHAATANWLRRDEETLQLLALSHLLGRDYARAWQCYEGWRAARGAEV